MSTTTPTTSGTAGSTTTATATSGSTTSTTVATATGTTTGATTSPASGTTAAPTPPSPIQQKYDSLGGTKSFLGAAVGTEVSTPGQTGQYAEYEHGMIFSSPAVGTYAITENITRFWKSPAVATEKIIGSDTTIMAYLGFPVSDSTALKPEGEVACFERGMIIATSSSTQVLYGGIYRKYQNLKGPDGSLGLPLSGIKAGPDGGVEADFKNGAIYQQGTLPAFTLNGTLLSRYLGLGGPKGELGYPTGDGKSISKGKDNIGEYADFQKGSLYSSSKGIAVVSGNFKRVWLQDKGPLGELGFPIADQKKGDDNIDYQNFENGVLVIEKSPFTVRKIMDLGAAVTAVLDAPAVNPVRGARLFPKPLKYQNYEKGILVWNVALNVVEKITKLTLVVDSFSSQNLDDIEPIIGDISAGQGLYVQVKVDSDKGFHFATRCPEGTQFNDAWAADTTNNFNPPTQLTTIPVRDGAMLVTVNMEGHCGRHSLGAGGDWVVGSFTTTYDINTLWDTTLRQPEAQAPAWSGKFNAGWNLLNDGFKVDLQDSADFRNDLFWSFQNGAIGTSIGELSWQDFASTFSDVSYDASWINHPFNNLFYLIYKNALNPAHGVCFGMSLECIYAIKGSSRSEEPIFQYPIDDIRKSDIAIKHGYQLGADQILYFLKEFRDGYTHDPKRAYDESNTDFQNGDLSILSISNDTLMSSAHAVVPYNWNLGTNNKGVIEVANPNDPYPGQASTAGDNVIDVDMSGNNNSFSFAFGGSSDVWQGNSNSGGRMFAFPYCMLSGQPVTPFESIFSFLVSAASILIMGDSEMDQITDGKGNTLYAKDAKGNKIINEDAKTSIATLVPVVPVSPKTEDTKHRQFFSQQNPSYDKMYDATAAAAPATKPAITSASTPAKASPASASAAAANIFHIAGILPVKSLSHPANLQQLAANFDSAAIQHALTGVMDNSLICSIKNADSSSYTWGHASAYMRATIESPAVKDAVDSISLYGIGTPGHSLSFTPKTAPKAIHISVSGPDNDHKNIFVLTNISLQGNHSISTQLNNGGRELIISNNGPATSFDLQLAVNKTSSPVKTGLKLETNAVMHLIPSHWVEEKVAATPIQMIVYDQILGGPVLRSATL